MTTLHTRVAKHGRSTVLIVPPNEAKKARLRPGQLVTVQPVKEADEPWAGSLTRLGMTSKKWDSLGKGMWD